MNIYVSNFKAKKELTFQPLDGPYEAQQDGDHYIIKTEDGTEHALTLGLIDNDYFSCDVNKLVTMTEEELREMVQEHGQRIADEMETKKDETADLACELMDLDPTLIDPLNEVLQHIHSTYDDKYNTPFPEVDNHWLKYGGSHFSSGFNVGSAASYLKRYLSQGFDKSYKVEDLYKTIHFLLYEIYSRKHNLSNS